MSEHKGETLESIIKTRLRHYPAGLSRIACTLYVDMRNRRPAKPLDLHILDRLIAMRLASERIDRKEENLPSNIGETYSSVWRWHGTGRYQNRGGKSVDILKEMILAGGLIPHIDVLDSTIGKGHFISTAKARMYARPYADMHRDRQGAPYYRYGKSSFWGKYFMMPVPLETFFEGRLWRTAPRKRYEELALSAMIQWRDKVTNSPRSHDMYAAFDQGSDICGNYPISIGLKSGAFEEAQISKAIGRHESRSRQPIPFECFTHLEVPFQNVAETRHLFNEVGLAPQIIPIEQGERHCSLFAFSDLVSGRPLVS